MIVLSFTLGIDLARHDPGLLRDRMGTPVQRGQPGTDKVLLIALLLLIFARPRHAPTHHDKLALAIRATASPEQVRDRRLAFGETVELAHGRRIAGALSRVHNPAPKSPRQGVHKPANAKSGLPSRS
jgi:hypothetical protein